MRQASASESPPVERPVADLPPGHRRQGAGGASSLAYSLLLVAATTAALSLGHPSLLHWFLIPVAACGVLMGLDAVDWLRGRLDLYSPVGILGLLGVYFFFLAPLLHVRWDYWLGQVDAPADWRPWLGWMGLINLASLAAYRVARELVRHRPAPPFATVWLPAGPRLSIVLGTGIVVTALLQGWVYRQFGGLAGYALAFVAETDRFSGMGIVFTVSEACPILAMILIVLLLHRTGRRPGWPILILLLVGFLAVQFLFGGLRGSRGNTIWALFWAAGLLHYWVRPLGRRLALAGLAFLFLFMIAYSHYKSSGPEAVRVLSSPMEDVGPGHYGSRPLEGVLLGDFSRSAVQALVLERIMAPGSDYELAGGRTYLGTLSLLVPRRLWADRPPSKTVEGTEALYGRGTYSAGSLRTSRIFGLGGETMLNFGPAAVPLAYLLLGLLVGWTASLIDRLKSGDMRLLLAPFLVHLLVILLIGDSDLLLVTAVKNGAIPLAAIVASARILRSQPGTEGPAPATEPEGPGVLAGGGL